MSQSGKSRDVRSNHIFTAGLLAKTLGKSVLAFKLPLRNKGVELNNQCKNILTFSHIHVQWLLDFYIEQESQ